jgi:hypothetical protein
MGNSATRRKYVALQAFLAAFLESLVPRGGGEDLTVGVGFVPVFDDLLAPNSPSKQSVSPG